MQAVYDGATSVPGWTILASIPGDDVAPFGVIASSDEDGKTAMAFRGTVTAHDWFHDSQFAFVPSPFGVGQTEYGFTTVFRALQIPLGWKCDWFAGHSLGGPLATYAALTYGDVNAELLVIATPEPGDGVFSLWASPRIAVIHRWENRHDVVPDAPGRFLGYRDLDGPTTELDFGPALGVARLDVAGNHSLTNYIRAFMLSIP